MTLSGEKNAPHPEDINDDLARETHFYEQALATANAAIRKLKDLGVRRAARRLLRGDGQVRRAHETRARGAHLRTDVARDARGASQGARAEALRQTGAGGEAQGEDAAEEGIHQVAGQVAKATQASGFADDGKARRASRTTPPRKKRPAEPRRGGQHGGASQKREFKDDKFGFGGRKRVRPPSPRFLVVFFLVSIRPAREERSLRSSRPAPTKGGCGACCPHAPTPSALGHLLIHGAYPELKRLRVTRAVVGWRRLATLSREPPASRRSAEHIPLPGGTRRRRHYLSGQTMLMLFDSMFSRSGSGRVVSSRPASASLLVSVFPASVVAFFLEISLVSGLTPDASPPRLAAQEAKRQGQRTGHDRL